MTTKEASPPPAPPIGTRVKVQSIDDTVHDGVVTEHDTKDGRPVFVYEYLHIFPSPPGGSCMSSKWAWPEQVIPTGAAEPVTA